MALLSPTSLFVLVGIFAAYLIHRFLRSEQHELPLPPGPKGIPLLGNLKDLPEPGVLECHHWLKHKDVYGPISSVTVLGQTFVVINDADIAMELLRDRAISNSGRPHMEFSGTMIGWTNTLAMSQPTEVFKTHRRNIAKVASSAATLSVFDRVQEEEAAHFLHNVLESPNDLFDHIRKEAGAVILRITYGYTPNAQGADPLVDLAGKTMEEFADASSPGRYVVDVMPFLKYLPDWCPGTNFKATARTMAKRLNLTAEVPYSFVKKQLKENKTHSVSFLSEAIKNIGLDSQLEHVHKWSAASMYLGGADTTVSALMTFFLAMMHYPEVQKKAQEELDRVIGNNRLPVGADKESLPYIDAIMKETHRWHPVAPMAIPHTTSTEQTVNGYRIPKGALLMPNTWWFTHDPSTYPSPSTFNPSRFLGADAQPDPRPFTFGYGRRVCPGRYVADNALFITIAQVLSVFDIAKPVENGKVVEPKVEFEPGVVSHPVPFKCAIVPRSKAHAELVRRVVREEYPWGESDAKGLGAIPRVD